eukprot:TRINITY_DN60421_c0_g1_i1.p1 TRINITY_DN60421_c0_g1~~TRINITY_DN60421_c0_g1_i1.p1  ORF type:complete len:293 (-),score=53.19 TRINITY_DN60421_c0_g1_i1:102-980(-)
MEEDMLELWLTEPGPRRRIHATKRETAGSVLRRVAPELGIRSEILMLALGEQHWLPLKLQFSDTNLEPSTTLGQAGIETGAEVSVQGMMEFEEQIAPGIQRIVELLDGGEMETGVYRRDLHVADTSCCAPRSSIPREWNLYTTADIICRRRTAMLREHSVSCCCDRVDDCGPYVCLLTCFIWGFFCVPEMPFDLDVTETALLQGEGEDDPEVLRFAKPGRCCIMPGKCCCFREVITTNHEGTVLGGAREQCWCCLPSFAVYGPDGEPRHELRPAASMCCCSCQGLDLSLIHI